MSGNDRWLVLASDAATIQSSQEDRVKVTAPSKSEFADVKIGDRVSVSASIENQQHTVLKWNVNGHRVQCLNTKLLGLTKAVNPVVTAAPKPGTGRLGKRSFLPASGGLRYRHRDGTPVC